MAKKSYIGINGKARKIKKAYIGINGVARKVKKIYIGIGNIARCIFTGGELRYYGTPATQLNAGRYKIAATHVGNYALFAGGAGVVRNSRIVDVYNTSLGYQKMFLGGYAEDIVATHVGNHALFAGDTMTTYTDDIVPTAISIDSSLTVANMSYTLDVSRGSLAATHVGNYAIFAGGYKVTIRNTVDAYASDLSKHDVPQLYLERENLAATHVGNYALFAGGITYGLTLSSLVEAYASDLSKHDVTQLSEARYNLAATHVGNYAIFAGGTLTYGATNADRGSTTVEAYDQSLTRHTTGILPLSAKKQDFSATTIGDYAIFSCTDSTTSVDVYNSSLTKESVSGMSSARLNTAATHVGNYAIFAGGGNSSTNISNVVDVYTIS